MNISSIGSPQTSRAPAPAAKPEAAETPGRPDRDGDGDDTPATMPAALPPGLGTQVDKKA